MAEQILRRVLNRFRLRDFEFVVQKWEPLAQAPFREELLQTLSSKKRTSKTEFFELVLSHLKKDKTWKKKINSLDLLYTEKYSARKTWSVFHLEESPDAKSELSDLKTFESKLKKKLSRYGDCEVTINVSSKSAYWIRILFKERGSSTPVYLAHHPQTAFVLVCGLKSRHSDALVQSLIHTLSCKKINELQLNGKCVNSLLKLCLQKFDKKNANRFLLKDEEVTVPESTYSHNKRKRKAPEKLDDLAEYDVQIVNENAAELQKQEEMADERFGKSKLPKLETLKYELETPFHSLRTVPGMAVHLKEPFRCRVKFSGSDVLEGLRNLCKAGLVQMPPKNHLTNIPLYARNYFVLRPKKNQNSTQISNASQDS